MSKIRVGTVVIVAILALAATALAQSSATGGQPGMSAQQPQPSMPGQPAQPAAPGQAPRPAAPGQPDTNTSAPQNTAPNSAAPASPADAVARQLAQLLNLNNTQTTQVRNVLEDEHTKLLALRDDTKLSAPEKQAKLTVIRRNASDKIMSILTPEQQRKLADAVQKQQQQNQQPGAQQSPPR